MTRRTDDFNQFAEQLPGRARCATYTLTTEPDPAKNVEGLLAYFGHHKCATQWATTIVGDISVIISRNRVRYSSASQFGHDLASAIDDPAVTFLCYTNADIRCVRPLSGFRGFHVIRDPRDIVVSSYFSHLYSHPTDVMPQLVPYRDQLRKLSQDDGLMVELKNRAPQFRLMRTWDYNQPHVLELRMEDLTTRTAELLSEIVSFLGFGDDGRLSDERLAAIVAKRDFRVLSGRSPGEEDVTSHYRKGVPGDWVNHFRPQHVDAFKERYPGLLATLGYEESDDVWG